MICLLWSVHYNIVRKPLQLLYECRDVPEYLKQRILCMWWSTSLHPSPSSRRCYEYNTNRGAFPLDMRSRSDCSNGKIQFYILNAFHIIWQFLTANFLGPHSTAPSRCDVPPCPPDLPEHSPIHDSFVDSIWTSCHCIHSVLHWVHPTDRHWASNISAIWVCWLLGT